VERQAGMVVTTRRSLVPTERESMNCFAHALPQLGDPWLVAGSCLPDWLAAVDRRLRIREATARRWLEDRRPAVQALARGIIGHHQDDHWFHASQAFQELNIALSLELRGRLPVSESIQTSFAAHVLIEMLIDGRLDELFPGRLDQFYTELENVDSGELAAITGELTGRDGSVMADGLDRFRNARFLAEYVCDHRVLYRLNRVLERVGLQRLPDGLDEWVAEVRQRVAAGMPGLLAGYPPAWRQRLEPADASSPALNPERLLKPGTAA
jgi:hypothetical protein